MSDSPYGKGFGESGLIPEGCACPFRLMCGHLDERCPQPGTEKDNDFSCGMARLIAICNRTTVREEALKCRTTSSTSQG